MLDSRVGGEADADSDEDDAGPADHLIACYCIICYCIIACYYNFTCAYILAWI